MRAALAFLASVALGISGMAVSPAAASEMSPQETQSQFWSFSSCIARYSESRVRELLSSEPWKDDAAETDEAKKLARDAPECAQYPYEYMKSSANLLRGSLAAALFRQDNEARPLPDYTGVPAVFGQALYDAAQQNDKPRVALLSFAECVFRSDPEKTRRVLAAEPASAEEAAAIGAISDYLGGCLPVEEGQKLTFSRSTLRALLGEAAYAVDGAYRKDSASTTEAIR